MLPKEEGKKLQKERGKKRGQASEEEGGERKKWRSEEGPKGPGDGGKKRLDAMSVGYFRRVGERLTEGFEDNEEQGKIDFSGIKHKTASSEGPLQQFL